MKIHILLIDNHKDTDDNTKNIIKFIESWDAVCTPAPADNCTKYDPELILKVGPDIVLIDVALLEDEEAHFEESDKEKSKLYSPDTISGIEYCRSIKANFANIPVILMS